MSDFAQTWTGATFVTGDGKGIVVPKDFRMIKIAEKKEGKRKGKTVATVNIPTITLPFSKQDIEALNPVIVQVIEELQKDILTRMQREGSAAVTLTDIDVTACVSEWTNRTFSAETVGAWFDSEMAEYLSVLIATAKGWDSESLDTEQAKYIQTKQNAYRGSFVETATKFPKLNPVQCQELLRVLNLTESSGPIVSRIREKITPAVAADTLGF